MKKPTPPNTDNFKDRVEVKQALEEADTLFDEIMAELDRIQEERGTRIHVKLFNEIFYADWMDRDKLIHYVVFHGLIGSSVPWGELELEIDLPGDQSLLAFARRKLEELKDI